MPGHEHVLEPGRGQAVLDGREHEVHGVALRVLEAAVQLHVVARLREERRVRVDLEELDVVRDREDLLALLLARAPIQRRGGLQAGRESRRPRWVRLSQSQWEFCGRYGVIECGSGAGRRGAGW